MKATQNGLRTKPSALSSRQSHYRPELTLVCSPLRGPLTSALTPSGSDATRICALEYRSHSSMPSAPFHGTDRSCYTPARWRCALAILMVLTSHSRSDDGEETGLRAEDFADPYYILADAGHEVVLTSPAGGMPFLRRSAGVPNHSSKSAIRLRSDHVTRSLLADTLELSQVFAEDFEGAYYAAGPGVLFDLPASLPCRTLTQSLVERAVPLCFVGEGTCLLIHTILSDGTRLVEGRLVTGLTITEQTSISGHVLGTALLEDEFRRLAGDYSCSKPWTSHVCVDGLLVTGQNWMSGPEAARRLLRLV